MPGGFAGAADHEKAAKGEGKEGKVLGPTYIKLPPIVLPVFDSTNKVTRQAGLALTLELDPGKTAADFEPNRPRLFDAFLTDLYTYFDENGASDRLIDAAAIKERLQETSDRVLGPGVVHEVLIQAAYERTRR